jgi:hypothetical protein
MDGLELIVADGHSNPRVEVRVVVTQSHAAFGRFRLPSPSSQVSLPVIAPTRLRIAPTDAGEIPSA